MTAANAKEGTPVLDLVTALNTLEQDRKSGKAPSSTNGWNQLSDAAKLAIFTYVAFQSLRDGLDHVKTKRKPKGKLKTLRKFADTVETITYEGLPDGNGGMSIFDRVLKAQDFEKMLAFVCVAYGLLADEDQEVAEVLLEQTDCCVYELSNKVGCESTGLDRP
jgi:hypothetical protein